MKRAALLALMLCLDASLTAHRAAAGQLNYTFYVVGLPAADAELSVDLAASSYRATLGVHTTGLADLVEGFRLVETVSGRFADDRPAPLEYASNGRLHGQDRLVRMSWHDGSPIPTAVAPPNAAEREEVPEALRARTVDPLSVIVLLLRLATETGRCEGSSRAYDGRVLQVFEARTVGAEDLTPSSRSSFSGRALRCEFTERTLAGYRFDSGRNNELRTHQGTVWLAQVVPGAPRLPVRASVETRWLGDATIYLTSVAP